MKALILITLYLVPCAVFADEFRSLMDPNKSEDQVSVVRSSMEVAQETKKVDEAPSVQKLKPVKKTRSKSGVSNQQITGDGDLPNEYFKRPTAFVPGDKAVYVSVKKGTLPGVLKGVKFEAVINEEITVSQTVTNPVSALIVSGPYAGSSVVGDARLDKELHRVLIDFSSITLKDRKQTFSFKGSALGDGERFNERINCNSIKIGRQVCTRCRWNKRLYQH